MKCGLSVMGDAGGNATTITLSADQELVVADATAQANYYARAGPLPAPRGPTMGWTMHVYVDHAVIEVIVNNETALLVFTAPADETGNAQLVGVSNAAGATLDAWQLASANNYY